MHAVYFGHHWSAPKHAAWPYMWWLNTDNECLDKELLFKEKS